jgi:hypothetical protein
VAYRARRGATALLQRGATSGGRQRARSGDGIIGTFYVSPDGSDSDDGLTEGTAFATPDAALAAAGPGSTILMERGGIWTDELTIETPVTFGEYGTGPLPVIDRGTEPTGALFDDGFESEDADFDTNWGGKTEATSTITVETTEPVRGTKSLLYTHGSNGTAYVTKTISSQTEIYIQLKVHIKTLVTGAAFGSMRILKLNPMFGWLFLQHDATPDRGVQVRYQGQTGNTTDTTYYQQGQTLRIELRCKSGTGTAGVQCWVNGDLLTGGAVNSTNTNACTSFLLGNDLNNANGWGTGSELLFDDVKVSTTAIGVGTRGDNGIGVLANDVTIEDIEVRNTNYFPLRLRDCLRATVKRTKLHDSHRTGLLVHIGGGDHLIEDNEIWFCGGDIAAYGEGNGIQLLSTTIGTNTIRDNDIHHCGDEAGDHGVYSEGGTNLIEGNRFREISGYGVKCKGGSAGSNVLRNRMEFCRTGIVNVDATSPEEPVNVDHNSGYRCGQFPSGLSPYAAFWASGYGKMRLRNNVSYNSAIGIQVDSNAELIESDCNDLDVTVSYGVWHGVHRTTLANWQAGSGTDTNSIEDDPLYTDPDAGDLTLQAESPAVDAGVVIPGVNDDFTGDGPDLGYAEVD